MGELGVKLGLDELAGGAAGISKALLAEFIGNLLLNLFGCGACVNISQGSSAAPDIVLIALTFGLTIFAVVSAIGHISGGHINPAVTAGLASAGKVKPARAVLYVIAQCAGAAAGSGLLKAFTPERAAGNLGVTGLGTNVSQLQGFGIEFFLGFVLVFVVCGVCDPNKPDSKATAPLAIGLTVTLGHLLAVDYTGSSMNPARSFGSALVANEWADHWVYWGGPVAGGVAAALLYVHVFSAPPVDASAAPPRYRPVAADDKEVYWGGPVAGGVAAALLYVHVFSAPPVDASAAPPRYRPVAADDKEVYWGGPVAGGVAAALLYVHVFSAPPVDASAAPPRYRPVAADDKEVYWGGPVAGGVAAALLYVHVFSAPPVDASAAPPRYRPVAADDKELKRLDGKADDLA